MNRLVKFKGVTYWFLDDDGDKLNGAIALLNHCDDMGNPVVFAVSFAHVFDGVIMRYQSEIGNVKDFEFLDIEL
jgi:hypothetical protein